MSNSNLNYPKTTINYGKDYYFYESITLSGATYYDNPVNGGADGYECHIFSRVTGTNRPQTMISISDGADIFISFNGNTDHIHLLNGTGQVKDYTFPALQATKWWFRGSGTIEISWYVI